MRSKWVALTGVVLVATVGCAVHPGAAAIVDGRAISQEYLEDAAADLGIEPTVALALLVGAGPYRAAADEQGVGVSESSARAAAIEQGFAAAGLTEATLSDGAVEVLQMALAVQAIGQLPDAAEVMTAAEDVVLEQDLEISPRYGELNPEDGRVSRPQLPWIVTPEPAAEPSVE